ncbi:MAG TPA: hypothetical protein VJS12_11755 [Steroidobacteraceae bacterium]|nr:hypothetical protein [Steroidobacteraceae bacterium]
MKSLRSALAASLLSSVVSLTAPAVYADAPSGPVPAKVAATQAAERDLWVGHIFWVREVVRGLAEKNQAAADFAEKQVVANAKQIAGSIEPFYGKAATDQLFKLLAGHYTAIKAHATATVAGDAAGQQKAIADLTGNANEIAKFLSGANPNLPEATLKSLLAAHGGHHVQQNQQLAAHDMAGEARTWDAMKSHIYTLADALVGGIAKQFPDKF